MASAGPCPKIEYADARDWPPDKLEARYCLDLKMHDSRHGLWLKLRDAGLLSGRDSKELMADSAACLEQADMLQRVLENVHKRPPPTCAAAVPASPKR
ncbi:MAG: hypothetical protein ACRD3W_32610 [Terriglobales bacterium]